MVVVLPEPLTPATRTMKGRAVISSGLTTGASTFSISAASRVFSASGVISGSKRPSPKPAAISLREFRTEVGANQLVLELLDRRIVEPALGEIVDRTAEERRGLLEPALRRCHQLVCVLSFMPRP